MTSFIFLFLSHTVIGFELNATVIAHYKFDGDLSDSSTNHHDGVITNGTEQYSKSHAISTQSFYFDGKTRIEIDSLSDYVWDATGYLSISLWIKSSGADVDRHMQLINNGNYLCSSFEIRIARDNSLQCAVFGADHSNHSQIGELGPPVFGHSFIFHSTLSETKWEHIVLTYNKNKDREQQLSLYLNGELLGNSAITDDEDGIIHYDHPLYIGHAGDECVSNDDYFMGYMDEIIIFEDELDIEEISMIYNDGVATMLPEIMSIETKQKGMDSTVLVAIILGSIIVILLLIIVYLCYKLKTQSYTKIREDQNEENIEMISGHQTPTIGETTR